MNDYYRRNIKTTPIIKIIPNYDVSENIFKSASYFKIIFTFLQIQFVVWICF